MDALEAKITALEKKEAEFQQNIKEIEEKPHRDEDDRAKLASLRRSLQAVEGRLAAVEQQITHHTAILAEEKKLMAHLMISGQRGEYICLITLVWLDRRSLPHQIAVVVPLQVPMRPDLMALDKVS